MKERHLFSKSMRWIVVPLILFYVVGVLFLHIMPTGESTVPGGEIAFEVSLTHLIHVAMLLPWGVLGLFYVFSEPYGRIRRTVVWVLLGLVVASAAEGVQYWLPYRNFSFKDLFFNFIGVLLGTLIIGVFPFLRSCLSRNSETDSQSEEIRGSRYSSFHL